MTSTVARPEIEQGINLDQLAFSATVEVEPAFEPEGYVGLEVGGGSGNTKGHRDKFREL